MKTKHLLQNVPYFHSLNDNALAMVAEAIITRHYTAGELIFLEGERGAGLHLVVQGLCKLYRLSELGREHILADLGPGDSCNEVPVVDGGPNPVNLMAVEDSIIWILSDEALYRLRKAHPVLDEVIIDNLALRCRQLVQRVYSLSFLSVTGRLAAFLLEQCDDHHKLSRRKWTQDDIAAHLGTVREMVGRALRELQEAGLITLDRHRIEVVDGVGLTKLT